MTDFLLDWCGQLAQWLQWFLAWSERRIVFEALMFGVILFALWRSRLKLKAVVDELGQKLEQQINAVRDTVEETPTEAPPLADAANWEKIRERWRDARTRMELAIDGVTDGRVRRKYSNLSRYSYAKIISELREDGFVTADAARALDIMNERFLSLRRARAATAQEANEFEELYRRADNALPKAPDE